jgi:hypothetical protein
VVNENQQASDLAECFCEELRGFGLRMLPQFRSFDPVSDQIGTIVHPAEIERARKLGEVKLAEQTELVMERGDGRHVRGNMGPLQGDRDTKAVIECAVDGGEPTLAGRNASVMPDLDC